MKLPIGHPQHNKVHTDKAKSRKTQRSSARVAAGLRKAADALRENKS